MRSYESSGVVEQVRRQGGEVYGITSEPHSLASEAEDAWELSFPIIGDPHHEIRKDLAARGWIDVFFNPDDGHLRHRSWTSHPNGYYQPAVISISKERRVLYRWRCVPKYQNMSGAGPRPEAHYTLEKINEALHLTGDMPLDRQPVMGAGTLNWLQFLLILTAHGWFIRPRAFPLLRDGSKDAVTPSQAMRRVWVFLGLWAAALVTLPVQWVLLAFLTWVVALTPGMIEIHRQFQNEPDTH